MYAQAFPQIILDEPLKPKIGLGFRVEDLGYRVEDFGFRV